MFCAMDCVGKCFLRQVRMDGGEKHVQFVSSSSSSLLCLLYIVLLLLLQSNKIQEHVTFIITIIIHIRWLQQHQVAF